MGATKIQTKQLPVVTSIGTPGSDTNIPSEKAVRTALGSSGGSGDVVGPASATDGHLAVFDGTTGKLVKDGGAVPTGGGGGVNVALGKAYTVSPAASASFPDSYATVETYAGSAWASGSVGELTDGYIGVYNNYSDAFWCAWDTTSPTIRLDLGTAYAGSTLRVRGTYGWSSIVRPVGYKVEYSDDDTNWTTHVDVSGLTEGGQPGARLFRYDISLAGAGSHRYWRLLLRRGNAQWLFLGEIEFWT